MDIIETTLLGGRVRLRQPKDGFHASTDTVFLAAAVPAKPGDKILDIGCGVGSAGFCVMARVPDCFLTGVDIQEDLIKLAVESSALNNLVSNSEFITSDISSDLLVKDRNYSCVLMNPPYLEDGKHTKSSNNCKLIANNENVLLEQWTRYAFNKMTKGGHLAIIHRADRLDYVLESLGRDDFGSINIFPLWPHTGETAKRVIVTARKHKKAPLVLHSGMVLHEADGRYTPQAENILRHAHALEI